MIPEYLWVWTKCSIGSMIPLDHMAYLVRLPGSYWTKPSWDPIGSLGKFWDQILDPIGS